MYYIKKTVLILPHFELYFPILYRKTNSGHVYNRCEEISLDSYQIEW